MRLSELAARLHGVDWSNEHSLTAYCPVHENGGGPHKSRSFSVTEQNDGTIVFNCFTDCDREAIRAALGVEWTDLFPPKPTPTKKKRSEPLTLAQLSAAKKIPVEWLCDHGVDQFPDDRGVGIGYFYEDERQAERIRVRSAIRAKDGSSWAGPKGVQPIPYGLWLLKEARAKKALIVVEGETDCWALWFHGYPALGLPGATNVKGLLTEHLREIDRVFVIQEPDKAGSAFPLRVAQHIRKNGYKGEIRSIAMVAGAKDPCDLHIAGTFDAIFPKLLDSATLLDSKATDKPLIDARAPYDLAQAYVKIRATRPEGRILHHWDDSFWIWTGTHFVQRSDQDQRAAIGQFLNEDVRLVVGQDVIVAPTSWHVSNVMDALKSLTNLPANETKPPQWINIEVEPDSSAIVALQNGLLTLSTGNLQPLTPRWFCMSALKTEYIADAECLAWLRFLESLWIDQQSRDTLQEIFGYLLTPDMRQQKIFGIIGPPRSGKGTIGRVLEALLGTDAVGRPAMADFGYQFGLEPLIGKSLGIISDARLDGSVAAGLLAERLLAISGEDGITVARKFQASYGGSLRLRFLILGNELPRFRDASGALPNRFILLKMDKSFLGREDPMLFNDLAHELPGILNWAIDGWMRLQERGHFTQPETSSDLSEQFQDLANPLSDFINEECIREGQIFKPDLYRRYLDWCSNLKLHPLAMPLFFRDLRAAEPSLRFGRHLGKPRHIQGIRLLTESEKVVKNAEEREMGGI